MGIWSKDAEYSTSQTCDAFIMVIKIAPKTIANALISTQLCTTAFISAGCRKDSDIVAVVAGEPVTRAEFSSRLKGHAAAAHAYFAQKYGAHDFPDFWTTSFEGRRPIDLAREKSLSELKRIKTIFGLAKKAGLVSDISYAGFLDELSRVNESREAAVAAGGIIYGPVHYGEDEYLWKKLNDLETELYHIYAKKLSVNDSIAFWYEQDKNRVCRRGASIRVLHIRIPFYPEKAASRDSAFTVARAAMAQLARGDAVADVARVYSQYGVSKERIYDDRTVKGDAIDPESVRPEAEKLEVGKVSEIFERGGAWHILYCVERCGPRIAGLEECSETIRDIRTRVLFSRWLEGKIAGAKVRVYQAALASVPIR